MEFELTHFLDRTYPLIDKWNSISVPAFSRPFSCANINETKIVYKFVDLSLDAPAGI